MAYSIEPNSTADLSPVTANDDNIDEVDDDDPFSKRRYCYCSIVALVFSSVVYSACLVILSKYEQENGWWG